MRRIIAVAALLAASALPTLGRWMEAQRNEGRDEREVIEVENHRLQAMIEVDAGVLSRVLGDDLVYTHSSGRVDTKSQLIDALGSHDLEYLAAQITDHQVRIYGNVAVVTGQATMKVRAGAEEQNLRIRFTDVYVKRDGRWQMVAWQSTRLAEPEKK